MRFLFSLLFLCSLSTGASVSTSSSSGSSAVNTATTISYLDEFIGGVSAGTFAGSSGNIFGQTYWQPSVSGTGAAINNVNTGLAGHASNVTLTTGTTTTGWAVAGSLNNYIVPSDGAMTIEFVVSLPTLSDGTNTYIMRAGVNPSGTSTALGSNELAFEYDSTQSANWRFYTRASSTQTTGVSTTAVTSGWHHLQIVTNAANSSVSFYVDGSALANSPLTTNVPTGLMLPYLDIIKSAGTTARTVIFDLFKFTQTLNSARYL